MKTHNIDNFSQQEIEETLQSLVKKGCIKAIDNNGEITYELTDIGEAFINHSDSDPSTQN